MASGNIIVFLSGSGVRTSSEELHPDVSERLKMVLEIFRECSETYHERGFSLVLSKADQYPIALKRTKAWLEQQGIPVSCISVEEFSWDIETGVANAWKHHIKGLTKSLKNPTVHIVSQSLDAYMIQQVLRTVSNGTCQPVVRVCSYASWRTFLAGAWRFACHQAGMTAQTIRAWKQINAHRS